MKRGEGGQEEGEVGAWRRKEKEGKQGEGTRRLRKTFRVLRAARDAFFFAPTAS